MVHSKYVWVPAKMHISDLICKTLNNLVWLGILTQYENAVLKTKSQFSVPFYGEMLRVFNYLVQLVTLP
jgi:hypothetical protein